MKKAWLACLLLLFAGAAHAATSVLLARYEGSWRPVAAMSHAVPLVYSGGKYVAAGSDEFQLGKLTRYRKGMPAPFVVDAGGIDFTIADFHLGAMGGIEHQVPVVRGWIRSPVELKHVFVAFDLHFSAAGRAVFVREIHNLEPGKKQSFEFALPPNRASGGGRCEVHFFSDGIELLQSRWGERAIRAEIESRVACEVEGEQHAAPRPFYVNPADRPASMRDDSPVRQVDVITTVAADGAVVDAQAASGSAPDYAAAAEKAVAGYFFLPKIVDGHARACRVIVSVRFDPKDD